MPRICPKADKRLNFETQDLTTGSKFRELITLSLTNVLCVCKSVKVAQPLCTLSLQGGPVYILPPPQPAASGFVHRALTHVTCVFVERRRSAGETLLTDAHKRFLVDKLPRVLRLHLKRFKCVKVTQQE